MSGTLMSLQTDKEIMKIISQRVAKERKVKDMSQKDLAELSGVALPTLRKFETKGEISLEKLIKITRALGRIEIFSLFFDFQDEYKLLGLNDYNKIKSKQNKKSVRVKDDKKGVEW